MHTASNKYIVEVNILCDDLPRLKFYGCSDTVVYPIRKAQYCPRFQLLIAGLQLTFSDEHWALSQSQRTE